MPRNPEEFRADPCPLVRHYSRFRVGERWLLSGHSHQAWPDRGFRGQQRAWEDAALHVDDKWERAFAKAERVREGYRCLLDDSGGLYSLAASTHDLLIKLFSALPLAERPKIVTTTNEFYSMARQLARWQEEGIEVVRVPSLPALTVGERLAEEVCERTAAVYTSTVFFDTAAIAGDLTAVADRCRHHGAALVLDVYHQLNVVPFSLRQRGLEDAFVTSAGYKYCQLGEGNAFLRFPRNCRLRPVATGWFAEFGELTQEKKPGQVRYASGNDRFAGATYDPTSHYRAAEVFDFFQEEELEPELLRAISQHQVGLLMRRFDELDLDPALMCRNRDLPLPATGGFLALSSPIAGAVQRALKRAGVFTDSRGTTLRLGPAPYLSDRQIEQAVGILGETVRSLARQ
ncbi:MAG: kynureninase [bacterium]|nr:kynureninase [bacterium]